MRIIRWLTAIAAVPLATWPLLALYFWSEYRKRGYDNAGARRLACKALKDLIR